VVNHKIPFDLHDRFARNTNPTNQGSLTTAYNPVNGRSHENTCCKGYPEKDMIDDVGDIAGYYNNDPERERSRLERHQLEADLTWRYLSQYLPARGSILEVGAATGWYTMELARRGYNITAVDMSAGLLEGCRQSLAEAGLEKQVRLVLADARDLHGVSKQDFDVSLMMGPLYHLVEEADRRLALKQVYDRLRPGGLQFSTFISRFGLVGDMMKRDPGWIEKSGVVRSVLERGKDPEDHPRGGFRGYFAVPSEILPLHESTGFETLTLAGIEPAISAEDESYNSLEGEQRQLWLELLYQISAEPSILGASRHLLYIGKKKI
jgi:SAM-dependent methyltransferase